MKFEYSTIEWLWQDSSIRVNLPGNEEKMFQGSYSVLVEVFNNLGNDGWEIVTCTSAGNWIFWTLKRTPRSGSAPK